MLLNLNKKSYPLYIAHSKHETTVSYKYPVPSRGDQSASIPINLPCRLSICSPDMRYDEMAASTMKTNYRHNRIQTQID